MLDIVFFSVGEKISFFKQPKNLNELFSKLNALCSLTVFGSVLRFQKKQNLTRRTDNFSKVAAFIFLYAKQTNFGNVFSLSTEHSSVERV